MFKSLFKKSKTTPPKETKNTEQIQLERNLKGKELEKEGKTEEAKQLYLKNIEEEFEGNHPYDRLCVIFRKEKDYDSEIKVLEKAVYVFKNKVYKERTDRIPKLQKFEERLEKVKSLKGE